MKSFLEWMVGQERDVAWLEEERQRLMKWPLEKLVAWLKQADPNGPHSEDMEPQTVDDAVELVMHHVEENLETPEEMMGAPKAGPFIAAEPAARWTRGGRF